jgi:predicted esterase
MRRGVIAATTLATFVALAGCDPKPKPMAPGGPPAVGQPGPAPAGGDPAPTELPKPPEAVDAPKDLPATHNGRDLSKLGTDDLTSMARSAAGRDDYKTALAAQFWAVKKGDDGLYDLACYYARNRMYTEAVYWIQKAAQTEGVDYEHAGRDEDLVTLRQDPRWAGIHRYLRQCSAYWKTSGKTATLVFVPRGFDKKKPSPVIVTLHGRGSRPDHFFGDGTQDLADDLGIPFVCVSGTRPTGPKAFVWAAEGTDADNKRLDAALAEAADKITIAPGKVITIGFSEGAQVALEVPARDPEKYAGGIAVSPGADFHLDKVQPSPELKKRRFVVVIGGSEHPGNVALARQDRDWFQKAGIQLQYVTVPRGGHSLPPDFADKLPKWVDFILGGKK